MAQGQLVRARPWWLWLHAWQWLNGWRAQPLQGTAIAAAWLLPCLLLPASLRLASRSMAAVALQWLSSFDVPLALVLAAVTGSQIIAAKNRPDTEDWLQPRLLRRPASRALFLLRIAGIFRWPAGLIVAAGLLALGPVELNKAFVQLVLVAVSGLAGGAAFSWVLVGQRTARGRNPVAPPASGLTALSLAPLFLTHRHLNLRRLAALSIPAMLAAPMGATTGMVARMLAAWLPLLCLGIFLRETGNTSVAIRRWMPHARLGWWIWRHALLAAAATCALLWAASLLMRVDRIGGHP